MMAERAYRRLRFRVYPTVAQAEMLEQWSRACVRIWNAALEQRQQVWRDYAVVEASDGTWRLRYDPSRAGGPTLMAGRSTPAVLARGLPSRAKVLGPDGQPVDGQVRQLQQARAEIDWVAAVPAKIANNVLYQLDKAYQAAWRRLRAGQPAGFPRYKRARHHVAVAFPTHGQTHKIVVDRSGVETFWMRLAGTGRGPLLKCRSDLPLDGLELGEMTIWEKAGRWWGSIVVRELAPPPPEWEDEPRICGINRGVLHLFTVDDGTKMPPIDIPEGELRELKRLQRKAARQHLTNNRANMDRRGRMLPGRRRVFSAQEQATRRRITRLYERHANIRREQVSLAANWLLDRYQVICVERFEIWAMMRDSYDIPLPRSRTRDLRRRILNQGWGELVMMLRQRAVARGRVVIEVDSRHISTTCPECGTVTEPAVGARSRLFVCGHCGHREDVDVVAARNVRMRGEALLAAERARQRTRRERSVAT